MSDKDPFAEPEDSDRTVIRPNPGGRRPASADLRAPAAAPATPAQAPADPAHAHGYGVPPAAAPARAAGAEAGAIALTGMNQLTALATSLFSLISRIRNRAQHMDPDKLRNAVVTEVRAFENNALQSGIDAQKVKVARYALCATLDDVVLNTPWGEQSVWAQQSMVGTFHRETVGGDRFYDLLARLEREPATNIDLLEFLYMCLSLGFEGRLRVEQGGPDKHLQIRNALSRIIRGQRGEVERDLSPHWKGVVRPHKSLSMWRPVWIALGATTLILMTSFAGLSWALGRNVENVIGQLSVLDSGVVPVLERRAPPPPPPPPSPPEVERLEKFVSFLAPEIEEGIVTVFENGNTLTIRLAGAGMFGSGSDSLQEAFHEPVSRVTEAIGGEAGTIIIAGHSDNIPLGGGGRFRDNAHLSLARAEAVMRYMADRVEDPTRLLAEGRSDREPIADNATPEGRATNRRIEILLVKGEDQ